MTFLKLLLSSAPRIAPLIGAAAFISWYPVQARRRHLNV